MSNVAQPSWHKINYYIGEYAVIVSNFGSELQNGAYDWIPSSVRLGNQLLSLL